MSSILEALRELEVRRPPPAHTVAAPAEEPTTANRAAETLGIIMIGLVTGAVALALFIWISGILRAKAEGDSAPPAEEARATPSPTPPAWLDRRDPPRALVDPRAPAASARSMPRVLAKRDADAPASAAGRVEVTSIDYAQDPAQRSVSLRLDGGDVVTLHENESARGVEVQLIQREGVYVRRGAEVLMLAPPR